MKISTPKLPRNHKINVLSNISPVLSSPQLPKGNVCKRRLGIGLQPCKKLQKKEADEASPASTIYDSSEKTDSEKLKNTFENLMLLSEGDSFFDNLPVIPTKKVEASEKIIHCDTESQDIFADVTHDLSKTPCNSVSPRSYMTAGELLTQQKLESQQIEISGLSQLFQEPYEPLQVEDKNQAEDSSVPSSYSQKNIFLSSLGPTPITQCLQLGPFFGLPSQIKDLIKKHKGIAELYDWQKECLKRACVREKKNLVYALPTSGGKTLVAEILLLREILCYQKNALFVLPFVAIVQEKVRSLSPFAVELGFLVEEYAAGKGELPPRKRRRKKTILVCTIEKALGVVQSLLEIGRLDEIGLAVIDELHLVGEGSGRGVTLETLITFLMASKCSIQLVGMSATIGNLSDVSKFINAEIYTGSFRPVELTEYVKCEGEICRVDYSKDDLFVHDRDFLPPRSSSDPDGLSTLVAEVCPVDSVLVFCATRKNCENVASLLCRHLPKAMLEHKSKEKQYLIETLKIENNGKICSVLSHCLPYGVVYHHSGLTADERKLLEEAYRDGIICCICCTSTLAAGVNLPAKRVILRAPYVGRDFISLSKYKQMVGRAGRAGLGASGESILICQSSEIQKVGKLLKSSMDEALSQLTESTCCDMVIAAVNLRVANTRPSIRALLERTLLNIQALRLNANIREMTDKIIPQLMKNRSLIVVGNSHSRNDESLTKELDVTVPNNLEAPKFKVTNETIFATSKVARAAMKGCMSVPVAHRLYQDLKTAKRSLNLQCDLHVLYLVTPYQQVDQFPVNRSLYFNVYMQLTENEQQAAAVIGITESFMARIAMGRTPKNPPPDVVNRFYVTLMLNELWKQRGVWDVSSLFQVPRGQVQTLQSAAATFCWNILRFCEEIEDLWAFRAILADFAPRLAHCCETELIPLMDLPAVKRARARQLYNAGFKTLQDIARVGPKGLSRSISHLSSSTASQIIAAAKMKLFERVENLKEEVEDVLEDIAGTDGFRDSAKS